MRVYILFEVYKIFVFIKIFTLFTLVFSIVAKRWQHLTASHEYWFHLLNGGYTTVHVHGYVMIIYNSIGVSTLNSITTIVNIQPETLLRLCTCRGGGGGLISAI